MDPTSVYNPLFCARDIFTPLLIILNITPCILLLTQILVICRYFKTLISDNLLFAKTVWKPYFLLKNTTQASIPGPLNLKPSNDLAWHSTIIFIHKFALLMAKRKNNWNWFARIPLGVGGRNYFHLTALRSNCRYCIYSLISELSKRSCIYIHIRK